MLETLQNIDIDIFLFLNGMHNFILDIIMYWISETKPWIPLWIFFIYLIIKNYGKKGIWLVLIMIAAVGLADFVSVHAFKNLIMRLRPCHNPAISDMVHIVRDHCGGQYGFVSSHSTNMFAIATFMSLALHDKFPKSYILFLLWASLIAYSRVYLGVHYPADIIGGAILGSGISSAAWIIAKRLKLHL